jgi:hypothetical protein
VIGDLVPRTDGALASPVTPPATGQYGSFYFQKKMRAVLGLDISPAALPAVTLEIWFKRITVSNPREWILGQDNGGYDRAIALNDDRFAGIAGPNGWEGADHRSNVTSTLGYPPVGVWTHAVVTYGAHVIIYMNGVGCDEGIALNGPGLPDFGIGGPNLAGAYANHYVDAEISQVRVYDRVLSAAEVVARYTQTRGRYGV